MAKLVIRELDDVRQAFAEMVRDVGERKARKVMMRAMNHEGAKGFTAIKRAVRKQTGLKAGVVANSIRFRKAGADALKIEYRATGKPTGLSHFNPRQFKYGVRARPWNRSQKFERAFIVRSLGGNVFINTGGLSKKSGRNNAIQRLWGPVIPNEMMRDDSIQFFDELSPKVLDRTLQQLVYLMGAGRIGGAGKR